MMVGEVRATQQLILEKLKEITEEEKQILGGRGMDRSLYQSGEELYAGKYEIDASLLLEQGKLITIRKHARFLHFPAHTHNYVEVVYMCSGSTVHKIGDATITLNEGELLFLNQNSVQEIYPAGENDIAVNFIILPEFFDRVLYMIEEEENVLKNFLVSCMTGANRKSSYLHYKVSEILPIQNLVENLIWTLMNKNLNVRRTNQVTMGLLFMHLANNIDRLETDGSEEGEKLTLTVLSYIEGHYRDGELSELSQILHYDLYWLSREIKNRTGQTFTELMQTKRLNQAAYLLKNSGKSVSDVAISVGYENVSYFHRIFRNRFGCSPKHFRDQSIQE